jgi:transposase
VDQRSGYGPRLTGFVGEIAGIVGASRSAVQDLCASVFGIPLSKGVIQKMVDRVSEAIVPSYDAIGTVARTASVNYIDETSWLMHGERNWLWVMANPEVAYFQIHPNRSKVAFSQLIVNWAGILVSDGYLVYQYWQGLRQSCWRICFARPAGSQSVWRRGSHALVGGPTLSSNGCVT